MEPVPDKKAKKKSKGGWFSKVATTMNAINTTVSAYQTTKKATKYSPSNKIGQQASISTKLG